METLARLATHHRPCSARWLTIDDRRYSLQRHGRQPPSPASPMRDQCGRVRESRPRKASSCLNPGSAIGSPMHRQQRTLPQRQQDRASATCCQHCQHRRPHRHRAASTPCRPAHRRSISATSASARIVPSAASSSGSSIGIPLGPYTPGRPGNPLSPPSSGMEPVRLQRRDQHARHGRVRDLGDCFEHLRVCRTYAISRHHHLLDLGDRLGRVQPLGADLGAVHDGVAAIELERILEIVEPLLRAPRRGCRSASDRPAAALPARDTSRRSTSSSGTRSSSRRRGCTRRARRACRARGLLCSHSFSGVGVVVLSHGSIERCWA